MTGTIKVLLWGEEIGRLSWDANRRLSYFTFNPAMPASGVDVSPLVASIKTVRAGMPVWGETGRIYQRLPAFLSDSLPDAWGNQLFEYWRTENHISNTEITPLDKLSFIGKRGMGALEFEPETTVANSSARLNTQALISLAQRIFTERESAVIAPEESFTMQSLISVGTSAGGRQPKAIIAINKATGEIRSGQIAGQQGFDYCILKFGDSRYCSAELEMTYHVMAMKAGINMMPSELIEIEGKRHFLTQRFDREGCEKLHIQTLAAIYPDAASYEELLTVCRKLHLPETDCEEVFRRMVFNHLANNTDDHNKNFSFIMNREGRWRLSPAYDMTYIIDMGGYLPNKEHCMAMRGKVTGVTRQDVLNFARDNGIRKPESIIKNVAEPLMNFREYATENGVREEWIGRVENCISQHLTEWNLITSNTSAPTSVIIGDKEITDIRIEQAYKGNIHLHAKIDGKVFKYVIRQKTAEHEAILQAGIEHVSGEFLHEMVEKFIVPKHI